MTATREFHPFGEIRSQTGSFPQDDIAYAGHEAFDEFDAADFSARSYQANLVGFVTPDRVALGDLNDPQSFNRYAYARMSPATYVDPDGNVPVLVVLGYGIVAFEVVGTAADVYSLIDVYFLDPDATGVDRAAVTAGTIAGMYAPGGGGGAMAIIGKKGADDALDIAKQLSRPRSAAAEAAGHGKTFTKVETDGLKQLFGQGPRGAQNLLDRLNAGESIELAEGLTADTLRTYRSVAERAIEKSRGRASAGAALEVQSVRINAIDKLLETF